MRWAALAVWPGASDRRSRAPALESLTIAPLATVVPAVDQLRLDVPGAGAPAGHAVRYPQPVVSDAVRLTATPDASPGTAGEGPAAPATCTVCVTPEAKKAGRLSNVRPGVRGTNRPSSPPAASAPVM